VRYGIVERRCWPSRPAGDKRRCGIGFFSYRRHPSTKMRRKILQESTALYQYDVAAPLAVQEAEANATRKNIRTMVYLLNQAGEPEKALKSLKRIYRKSGKPYALEEALRLALLMGEISEAKELVGMMNRQNVDSPESYELRADYYYIRKNLPKSYRMLRKVRKISETKNRNYLRKLGDLAWYLGHREVGLAVARRLEALGDAKLTDYERIVASPESAPNEVQQAALKGWERSGNKAFFLTYAYRALEDGKYRTLYRQMEALEKDPEKFKPFREDAHYYLIKAQLLLGMGETDRAFAALEKARKLQPHNPEIEAVMLWALMDQNQSLALRNLLEEIEQRGTVNPRLWLPLAAAYFKLQQGDRSEAYIRKLLKREPDNVDLNFLDAYIAQVQNEEGRFMMRMRRIHGILTRQWLQDPRKMQDPTFAENYLRSAMYLIPVDEYQERLERSRSVLGEKRYRLLRIDWALKHDAYARARNLMVGLKRIEPWMALTLALHFEDLTRMQDLLYRYYAILPIRDRVTAADRTGNLSFAYSLAYAGLEANRQDERLYDQLRQLVQRRADLLDLTAGWRSRADSLRQSTLRFTNRNYLARGFWAEIAGSFSDNRLIEGGDLATAPSRDLDLSIALKKEFDRGSAKVQAGYREAMESYGSLLAAFDWQLDSRWRLASTLGYHSKAEETLYTLLGGYKDWVEAQVDYRLLPSTTLTAQGELARFLSQDDVELGTGFQGMLQVQYQLRQGYPDLVGRIFLDYGTYSENGGSYGVIDRLLPYTDTRVLPDTFAQLGVSLAYGMQNEVGYTRVWRPFAEITPLYDFIGRSFSMAVHGGIGGSIYHQDHLDLVLDYNQALSGTNESSYGVSLRYKFFY